MPELFIRVREPEVPTDYDKYDVDNISVYLYKNAKTMNTLVFKMADYVSDLADKEIDVEGIEIL